MFRYLLLLGCLITALSMSFLLEHKATAWNGLLQASPLSPLEVQPLPEAEIPAATEPPETPDTTPMEVEEAPSIQTLSPLAPPASPDAISAIAAEPAATLPLGEPLKTQASMVLVGLVLAGLVALVVLIVVRQQAT